MHYVDFVPLTQHIRAESEYAWKVIKASVHFAYGRQKARLDH